MHRMGGLPASKELGSTRNIAHQPAGEQGIFLFDGKGPGELRKRVA